MRTVTKRGFIFLGAVIGLSLVIIFMTTMTVRSQSNIEIAQMERYYRELETEMVKDVRQMLNSKGYDNSGISLTRVVNEDGSREYTLTIHHKKITQLSEEGKADLKLQLGECNFDGENCSFNQEFLVMDL